MARGTLDSARRAALGGLHSLEASDRALTRALAGDCTLELRSYLEAVRRARRECAGLERLLLDELRAREPGQS